jgi:hypothetical protein
MALQLWMALLRIEDMPKPGVLEEDHAHTLRGCGLGKDRTVTHVSPFTRRSHQPHPHSGRDDFTVSRGYRSSRTGEHSTSIGAEIGLTGSL